MVEAPVFSTRWVLRCSCSPVPVRVGALAEISGTACLPPHRFQPSQAGFPREMALGTAA